MQKVGLNGLTVFLTSVFLMTLEFVQVRILAFTHFFHFAYFSITLALLGFAISGTLLATSRRLREKELSTFYAWCLVGFALSSFLAGYISATYIADVRNLIDEFTGGKYWMVPRIYIPILLALMLPFIFSSLVICRGLMGESEKGRLYALNLLGTALGGAFFLGLIGPLGAYRLNYAIILSCLLLALCHAREIKLRIGIALAAIVLLPPLISPSLYFRPAMDHAKNLATEYPDKVLDTVWTPIFRVDIADTDFGARITIDGDAQTWVHRIRPEVVESSTPFVPDREQVSRHGVFQLTPPAHRKQALVIGAGGGMDVFAAYQAGFGHIDAVDIDPVRLEWLKGKYAPLLSNLMRSPRITTHAADGRSFVRHDSTKKYDAIILYNVDSLTAVSTGAYNLVESYLYTVEAFENYFEKLSEHGQFQVTRPNWGGYQEFQRVFLTCIEVLLRQGLDPKKHLLVMENGYQRDFIVSKKEITPAAVAGLAAFYRRWGVSQSPVTYFGRHVGDPSHGALDSLMVAAQAGKLREAYAVSPVDIAPITDDRPFFFESRKWMPLFKNPRLLLRDITRYSWMSAFLFVAAFFTLLITTVLAGFIYRGMESRPRLVTLLPSLGYFFLLGVSYMVVQTVLMQRLSLVLGHPVFSMAVIVPTLLVGMGISSFATSIPFFRRPSVRLAALLVAPLMLLIYETVLYPLTLGTQGASFAVRVVVTIATCAPIGLALGVCFPYGLKIFSDKQDVTSLAWTVNGGGSVFGSIAAVLLSLIAGFHVALLTAISLYLFTFAMVALTEATQLRLQRRPTFTPAHP